MSAESPRRTSRVAGNAVRPQPVSDKTVVESVVDFIQDVAYTTQTDDKEKIHWVRFEQADINDLNSNPECDPSTRTAPPLLLILGYGNGFQIWIIPSSGEAQEILSVRQGPVQHVRLLPQPSSAEHPDLFSSKRPLLVICDASSAGQPYRSVKFISLRTGDEVHSIPFTQAVTDIKCNDRVLAVAFTEKIVVYDACQFKERFWITACFPSPGPNPNPFDLGSRWLAYADKMLVPVHQSCGGMSGDGGQSYAATIIHAAKSITKGLTAIGETLASSMTGNKPSATKRIPSVAETGSNCRPGVVTIIDIQNVVDAQVMVQEDSDGVGLVAHFPAHASEPITALAFDPNGMMLLTADKLGHSFNLFRIMAHPWNCSLGAAHHLYTLQRGDTTAKVQSIDFTLDSRWVAITTLRGTTHVFPITTYGGQMTTRTHTTQHVVNRASRFHRSAGLEDMDLQKSGRDSPVHGSGSPGSSPGRHLHDRYRHLLPQTSITNNMNNPRLPPYPHPTTVYPLVQIRQNIAIPGIGSSSSVALKGKAHGQGASAAESVCVAACFAPSRGWVAGSPSLSKDRADIERAVESLYIMTWTGLLTEYILSPHAKSGLDKVTDDTPLEMTETPRAQWSLGRSSNSPEVKLPLPSNSCLLMASELVANYRANVLRGLSQGSRELLSSDSSSGDGGSGTNSEQWLSQVEMITHAGPHRRLWMGPQFSFKTFQGSGSTVLSSSSAVLLSDGSECQRSSMDVVNEELDLHCLNLSPTREQTSPLLMPGASSSRVVPDLQPGSLPYCTFIEANESGSYGYSPGGTLDIRGSWPEQGLPSSGGLCDSDEQLKEHLAEAMNESPLKDPRDTRDLDALSTSSESSRSTSRGRSYSARSSPPHSIDHVLIFPSNRGSPDSN